MRAVSHQSQLTVGDAAVYRAGDLLIDTGRQRVMRGENDIPLPKLSFELLLALVRASPNVVSLDVLMQQVWPNLVVNPETVSQRVKLLRDALGDDPREPRYVAGLRGRGYRMAVPVTRVAPAPAMQDMQEAPALAPEAVPRSSLAARRPWTSAASLAALVLIVVAAGVVWVRMGSASREASAPPSSVTVSALPERTVAVLPFENMSSEGRDEFVALGIAEGVLHRLAGIRDITLIARTSSFSFRGKAADARDIGLKLNARYLVEGSVQRADDRLRVTAQLIDAATGARIWSLRFDRTMDDIFAVEDEISQSVARALEVSLSEGSHPFARFGTDAYLAFLQGRALIATRKVADAELAIERFSRAVAIAPAFAAAYVALADAHIHLAQLNDGSDSSPAMMAAVREAGPLLAKALQLDDSLGEAYGLRGWLKMTDGDKTGAVADYEKGIALSPNYAPGLQRYAEELDALGRQAEALNLIDRARRVDPLYPRSHYFKGLMMLDAGSLEEAEALFLRALQIAPDFHPALMRLGTIRKITGRFAEAVNYSERAVAIDPRAMWTRVELSALYLDLGEPDAARHVIAELPDAPPNTWVPICLYENDLEGAHNILGGSFGPGDLFSGTDPRIRPFVSRAVRDQALASGNLGGARKLMQAIAQKWDPTVGEAKPGEESFQFEQILVAAQWRKSFGERRSAEASARAVMKWPDESERRYAVALAILGRNDAAVAALERAVAGGDLHEWWYDVDREPAFAPLREDPRFRALAADARAHLIAQRKLLEQMRRDGAVPVRTMPASAARRC